MTSNSKAVGLFVDLMKNFRDDRGPKFETRPLTNFTIWAGAGFAKSWRSQAPLGKDLFKLDQKFLSPFDSSLALARIFGKESFRSIRPNELRRIVYQLDMYEKYPEIRSRYVDEQNVRMFHASLRSAVVRRYAELADLDYFDVESGKFAASSEPTDNQRSIMDLIRFLMDCGDGSEMVSEGIRTHFITTNYDFVIEAIVDNVLGADDSVFLYTYRGFTPKRIAHSENPQPLHDHWLVWNVLKINGGFEILQDDGGYVLDYRCRTEAEVKKRPPVLMLPSREQNYEHPYFQQVFPKAVRLLRETTVLLVIGYSFPKDDALLRFILRQFSEEIEDGRNKCIFLIDPSAEDLAERRVPSVFSSTASGDWNMIVPYIGSFGEFAAQCVELICNDSDW